VDDLSLWTKVLIVAGAAALGPVAVFLLSLLIAVLLRMVSSPAEPPAVVLVAAARLARMLRRTLRAIAVPSRAAVKTPDTEIARPNPV
jgi:hypothetical protein